MELILWLILGAAAGVMALYTIYRTMPDNPWQWVGALIIGLIGGWVGGFLANIIGLEAVNWIGSLIVAFVGAVLILLLFRRLSPNPRVRS